MPTSPSRSTLTPLLTIWLHSSSRIPDVPARTWTEAVRDAVISLKSPMAILFQWTPLEGADWVDGAVTPSRATKPEGVLSSGETFRLAGSSQFVSGMGGP